MPTAFCVCCFRWPETDLVKSKTCRSPKHGVDLNYEAQKKTTTASLEDRQRARMTSNAGAYQSVDDYMSQNGMK